MVARAVVDGQNRPCRSGFRIPVGTDGCVDAAFGRVAESEVAPAHSPRYTRETMLVIPAIDLLAGECVRLYQGDYRRARSYDTDPLDVARRFESAGATRIHVVDLDAARGDGADNRDAIRRIVAGVSAEVEVGGGVRSESDVEELIDAGARRLIVGTVLAADPDRVASWVERYDVGFIAGIDARDGLVGVSGWKRDSGLADTELAGRVAGIGVEAIIYTNISLDGTLGGPDLERTNLIAEISGIDVILSGGVSSAADIRAVRDGAHRRVIGIITGKALYEGTLDLVEAIRIASAGPAGSSSA